MGWTEVLESHVWCTQYPPPHSIQGGEGLERPLSQAVHLAEEAGLNSWWLSKVTRCLPITGHHPRPTRSGSAHSAIGAWQGLPCCACVACSSPWFLDRDTFPSPASPSQAALDFALSKHGSVLFPPLSSPLNPAHTYCACR